MNTRKTLALRSSDPHVQAWRRAQMLEDERDGAATWLVVPFRMFIFVSFLGTLLQMEMGGLGLHAALATAATGGLAFAVAWMILTYWYGGELPQIFLRSLLIFSLIAMWFAATQAMSPGWRVHP